LKAIIAKQNKENLPIHNLSRLVEIAEIKNHLNSEQFNFLAELTPYRIEARYGDYKEQIFTKCKNSPLHVCPLPRGEGKSRFF